MTNLRHNLALGSMALRPRLSSSRHLMALFIVAALLPSIVLLALGWRLLQQDVALERQQRDAGREQAVDLAVSALDRVLGEDEARLRGGSPLDIHLAPVDALWVTFSPGGLQAIPENRLLYWPEVNAPQAPSRVFDRGDRLEHLERNPAAAAEWFRALATSPNASVRAGALIGLARNLRKLGRPAQALEVYEQVSQLSNVAVAGVPADLLARHARCDLFADAGDTRALRREAEELRDQLLGGRWRVTRPVLEAHLADIAAWTDTPAQVPLVRRALAGAVEQLWRSWKDGSRLPNTRWSLERDGITVTLLSQQAAGGPITLIAGPEYARWQWISRTQPLVEREGLHLELYAGRPLPDEVSRRTPGDTGLPWTVVTRGDSQAPSRFGGRRALWLAGLLALAILATSGTYVIHRAVSRELAVARLESDFVAAVSHEFRTPLTSLRQLSEMLIDRPDAPVDRRMNYYLALRRQSERLQRLVEGLLDFGRLQSGAAPYRIRPLDASALVSDVVEEFRCDPAARGHQVELQTAPNAWTAADADALRNALWNLLDNAAKYSPGTSTIWIDVERTRAAVAIHVRDAGFGIPAPEQAQIFRKFVRGERARREGIMGTGIGLAMVEQIVEAHQGVVRLSSRAGEPTVFTVELPALPQPLVSPEGPQCLES